MNTKKHDVPEELLSGLLANYKKPEDLIGENGLLKQLTKLLVERALDAELTEHLGHERNEAVSNPAGNTRNGKSRKTLKGDFGELPIEVPRDRHGSFEPQLIPKHQTRWAGFDDKIISLYARGMTVREIQAHLEEMYGAEVSPSLISSVTDAVADEVKAWQARPLTPCQSAPAVPSLLSSANLAAMVGLPRISFLTVRSSALSLARRRLLADL